MQVLNNLKSRDQQESRLWHSESELYKEPISMQMMSFFSSYYIVQAALQNVKWKQKRCISIARYQLSECKI